jgi:hypothetical protein
MNHPVGVYRHLPLAIHAALVNIKSGGLARGNFENVCLCRGVIDRRDDVGAVGAIPLESARKHFFFVRPKRVAAPQQAQIDVPRFSAVLSLTTSVGRFLLRRDGLRRQA